MSSVATISSLPATHSCSLKLSFVLCSAPLSPTDSSPADSLDVQIKMYTMEGGTTYRVQGWLIDYGDSTAPGGGLLKEHTAGSAAICYVVDSKR